MKSKIILLTIICFCVVYEISAQCVQCEGGDNSGTNASIIGTNNIASGNSSFAGGKYSEAQAKQSFAFGENALTMSAYSVAMGQDVTAFGGASVVLGRNLMNTSPSIIFGSGFDNDNRLKNTTPNCLIIGFNSTKPTFFVSESKNGSNSTGKIGIGNVTEPQAKLHILGDNTSYNPTEASLYIQSAGNYYSTLWLGDKNHSIYTKPGSDFKFKTSTNNHFVFENGNVGIGTTSSPTEKLEVNGNIKQSVGYNLQTEKVVSKSKNGLTLFTSLNSGIFIDERGQVSIGNTKPAAALDVNGKIKASALQIPDPMPPDNNGRRIKGYVLTSYDEYGNVAWTPQDALDDGDWDKNGADVSKTTGKVGIGTNAPTQTLDVQGTFRVSPTSAGINGIFVNAAGNVGIGTSNPQAALHIGGNVKILSGNENDQFQITRGGQKPDRRGISLPSDPDGAFNFYIHAWQQDAAFNFKDGLQETDLMIIHKTGSVSIGAPIDVNYKLAVAGKIRSTELTIEHIDDWYDCVFEENYPLTPLAEIEQFVRQNKHLPEVPSEAEVKANGIDLGEMNAILLKKIEELTLHVIKQQKEIDALKQAIK